MKRPFLLPLAALAAALTSGQSMASAPKAPALEPATPAAPEVHTAEHEVIAAKSGSGNIFNFVLERGAGGVMMAYHSSHASHASHVSHASHSSHASGY